MVKDDRLLAKELVIGLEQDGEALAFPYTQVDEIVMVNDTFQEIPVVLAIDPKSGSVVVFRRVVEGQALTFERQEDQAQGLAVMLDQETGSRWSILTGEAVEGPMAGAQLERFRYQRTYWFTWKDFNPHTEVYGQ